MLVALEFGKRVGMKGGWRGRQWLDISSFKKYEVFCFKASEYDKQFMF